MKHDLLDRAAQVARERYDGESERAANSEQRILRALGGATHRRRRLPLLAIPLVAALLASVAWGTVSEKLRALVRANDDAGNSSSQASPKVTAHDARRLPSLPSPSPDLPAPEPSAPELARSQALPAPASARAGQRLAPPSKAPPTATPPEVGYSEAEVSELYRAAHRAQFSGGDSARALELWDRYLAAAPNGALSPEARYNRAIALTRLGRKAEAASALEPFARGDYGGYRKSEAEALLGVLRPSAKP